MINKSMQQSKKYIAFVNSTNPEEFTKAITVSVYNACVHYKVSELLIKRYAAEFNISWTKKFTTVYDISDDTQKEIVSLYANTFHTKREIREFFEIGTKTLNKILKNHNAVKLVTKETNCEFIEYTKLARRLTTVTKNHYNLVCNKGTHWDHMISVYDGFKQNIPAYLIAARENLELIESAQNLLKGADSSQTKLQLYQKLNITV